MGGMGGVGCGREEEMGGMEGERRGGGRGKVGIAENKRPIFTNFIFSRIVLMSFLFPGGAAAMDVDGCRCR